MDEDLNFDPSLKKKKKKKKPTAEGEEGTSTIEGTGDNDSVSSERPAKDVTFKLDDTKDEDIDVDNFGLKKKKKKKKDFNLDELGDALPDAGGDDANTAADAVMDDLDLEDFGKKKKKKKRVPIADGIAGGAVDAVDGDKADDVSKDDLQARLASEQDHTYDQLLSRAFRIIRDNNPELATGEKRKFVMRPPQVAKVGTKKTAFVNFSEISKMLHRQPKHLLSFLTAELGTVGTVDGSDQLILKGRYTQKHMENVLRRYIKEYVTCHTCRSPDTILNKETRLFFLQCMSCQSRCSVQTIKTGFQAVTSKRSLNRK